MIDILTSVQRALGSYLGMLTFKLIDKVCEKCVAEEINVIQQDIESKDESYNESLESFDSTTTIIIYDTNVNHGSGNKEIKKS